MRIASTAFTEGGFIPLRHTCDGADVSPALSWADVPDGTVAFSLLVVDPDAPGGTFVHWVVFNIGGNRRGMEEGRTPPECQLGTNDFGRATYSGPCPPRGNPHSYHFTLYAMDARVAARKGCTMGELERAMKGHTLDEAHIIGLYGR